MSIAPFSFRELGVGGEGLVPSAAGAPRPFLPQGRKKEEAAPPPPPPPPTFSEEQLKASERDGYQKGFLDGVAEGKVQAENAQAQVDAALTDMVKKFAAHYAPLFGIYREMIAHQAKLLPQMAHSIAKKVAGDALAENAYSSIEAIALRCVSTMMHEPKLVITIHESMKETLEKKLAIAQKSLQMAGEMVVVGDAHIAPPNCRIEWKNGAMVRDTESLWQQVEQVVATMVTSSEREAETLCEQMYNVVAENTNTAEPIEGSQSDNIGE